MKFHFRFSRKLEVNASEFIDKCFFGAKSRVIYVQVQFSNNNELLISRIYFQLNEVLLNSLSLMSIYLSNCIPFNMNVKAWNSLEICFLCGLNYLLDKGMKLSSWVVSLHLNMPASWFIGKGLFWFFNAIVFVEIKRRLSTLGWGWNRNMCID